MTHRHRKQSLDQPLRLAHKWALQFDEKDDERRCRNSSNAGKGGERQRERSACCTRTVKDEAEIAKNVALASFATALASMVLPFPGGLDRP